MIDMKSTVNPTVIPIQPVKSHSSPLPAGALASGALKSGQALRDQLGRSFRDLRISVTDRCNFRCTYCMPKEVFDSNYAYLPQNEILSFEEINTFVKAIAPLGLKKIRLTGGEPLLRKNIDVLIAMLRDSLPEVDLTLTTNGAALAAHASRLKTAGLDRVTVSLDALDDAVFRQMNDVDFPVAKVLEGVDAAAEAGLGPVKINAVIKRGVNEDQVIKMVRHFRHTPHIMRFIEFMDVGSTNGWRMNDVFTAQQMLDAIATIAPIESIDATYQGEVAQRWRFVGDHANEFGAGGHANEFGVIASVTQAFCGDCNRARLSTDGQIFTCLFADQGYDVKHLLRGGASAEQIQSALIGIWQQRRDRYSQLRTAATTGVEKARKVEMSFIGG
jgi:GTP 3',8-cyclase